VDHAGDLVGPTQPAHRDLRFDPSIAFSGTASTISVAMYPGATVFTVMPIRRHRLAGARQLERRFARQ